MWNRRFKEWSEGGWVGWRGEWETELDRASTDIACKGLERKTEYRDGDVDPWF